MAADQRKRIVTLAALLVVLAGVLAWQFWPSSATPPAASGSAPAVRQSPATAGTPDPRDLEIRLDALARPDVRPDATGRDPFGFRPAPPPPPPPAPPSPPPGQGAVLGAPPPGTGEPPPPPPPPPIPLKFIGVIVEQAGARKVAVLSDGRFVFHGREGDIIEGRYRVVHIGDESIQMEYTDGRGRQTIRLSGS